MLVNELGHTVGEGCWKIAWGNFKITNNCLAIMRPHGNII